MCDHLFVEIEDGCTIRGEHFHLYRCTYCRLYDLSLEKAASDEIDAAEYKMELWKDLNRPTPYKG